LVSLAPLFLAFDQNGGLLTFGFSRGMTLERHFKIRPDYATGRLFAAERQELPSFKQLQ